MRRLIVLAALGLCACGGEDKDPSRPAVPDVASNFNGPIDARGADPQWDLTIRGLQLALKRPNQPALAGLAPGMALTAHTAAWTASLPNGQVMKVRLYASPCVDAVSGAAHPFAAEVLLPGGALLNGCAAKSAAP